MDAVFIQLPLDEFLARGPTEGKEDRTHESLTRMGGEKGEGKENYDMVWGENFCR